MDVGQHMNKPQPHHCNWQADARVPIHPFIRQLLLEYGSAMNRHIVNVKLSTPVTFQLRHLRNAQKHVSCNVGMHQGHSIHIQA